MVSVPTCEGCGNPDATLYKVTYYNGRDWVEKVYPLAYCKQCVSRMDKKKVKVEKP